MNTKTYLLGFKIVSCTATSITAVKDIAREVPRGFRFIGREVRDDAREVKDSVASFFAGAAQAARIHTGKCRVLSHEETKS